jgi:hypothetical protein
MLLALQRRIRSRLELTRNFTDFLTMHHFRVVDDGAADGDCLFEALLDQLYTHNGDWDNVPAPEEGHERKAYLADEAYKLRLRIVDEIRCHYQNYVYDIFGLVTKCESDARLLDYQSLIDNNAEETKMESIPSFVQEYLDRLSTRKEVGDAVCVAAFANLYHVPVRVYFEGETQTLSYHEFTPYPDAGDQVKLESKEQMDRQVMTIAWKPSHNRADYSNHYVSIYPEAIKNTAV